MKRKTNFKQMFLVDNSFISRVNNENRVSVSNTFSPIQGGEVIGSKDDECKECSSSPSSDPPFIPPPPQAPILYPDQKLFLTPTSSTSWSAPTSNPSPPKAPLPPVPPSTSNPPLPQAPFLYADRKPFSTPHPPTSWTAPTSNPPLPPLPPPTSNPPVPPLPPPPPIQPSNSPLPPYQPPSNPPLPQAPSNPPYQTLLPIQGMRPFEYEEHQWLDNIAMDVESTPHPPMGWVKPTKPKTKKKVVVSRGFTKPPIKQANQIKKPEYSVAIPTPNEYSYYTCTICNTNFNKRNALERHMKNIHDAYQQKKKGTKHKETFTCDICPSEFKSKKVLDRHMKNIHTAFSQVERGMKRKNEMEHRYPRKYVKW